MDSYSQSSNSNMLEVNFEQGVTLLYDSITNSDWNSALHALNVNPQEARTWVVRYNDDNDRGIMWRFLPLHSASARQPPDTVINSLLRAFPEAAACGDDQGMYPIHYACGNQASAEAIRAILSAYPKAVGISDPNGMYPIHYMAQWGPSSKAAIDLLVRANQEVLNLRDEQGNTPLDYAEDSDYPLKDEMITALKIPLSSTHTAITQQVNAYPNTQPNSMMQQTPPHNDHRTQQNRESSLSTLDRSFDDLNISRSHSDSTDSVSFHMQLAPRQAKQRIGTISNPEERMKSIQEEQAPVSKPTQPVTSKQVIKLKAEIAKLKAEAAFIDADMEDKLLSEREKFDLQRRELKQSIHMSKENISSVNTDLKAKVDYIKYMEARTKEREKEFSKIIEDNNRLQIEVATITDTLNEQKEMHSSVKMRGQTLASSLKNMIDDQEHIIRRYAELEDDARNASQARKQKLQELFEDEMRFSMESMDLKRVYGPKNGPLVKGALEQQKGMMENCLNVLSSYADESRDPLQILN